jgi:hypothetical protein
MTELATSRWRGPRVIWARRIGQLLVGLFLYGIAIEVTVLTIGWILGGQVGIGTVAFALLIGPLVNLTLPLLVVPVGPLPAGRSKSRKKNPKNTKEVTA